MNEQVSLTMAAPAVAERKAWTLRQANFALAVFLAAYVLSFVDRQILGLMVDPIRHSLDLSDLQIGLLQGVAFALLYATMGVPFGMAVDRWSRRNLIIIGVVTWSAATAMCGVAETFAALFMARIAVGVGEAMLSPAVHSFLADAYPAHRLARAMSIYMLGITVGSGLALIIGGSVVALISQSGATVLPVIGTVEPWQATFLVVAAPGLLIALMVLLVREPGRSHNARGRTTAAPGIGAVLRNLWVNRRAFAAIHFSSALFGVYGNGFAGWYPSLLIRTHGLTPAQAGTDLGVTYLVFGSLGTIVGGRWSERMALSGKPDANLRVVVYAAGAALIPAALAPLMPSPLLVLALFAPACFAFYTYFSCGTAAIQLASPPEMRGTNSALFLLTNSLVGLSAGMLAVPMADRYLFGGTGNLGPALALVAAIGSGGALVVARSGLASYGALVERNQALAAPSA